MQISTLRASMLMSFALAAPVAAAITACDRNPVAPSSIASAPAASAAAQAPSTAAIPWAADPTLAQALAALRDATDQFHDEAAARAAGYRPSAAGCESSATGAMGIHYGHPALLGLVLGSNPTTGTDAVIDPLRPEVLMYEPQDDGGRRLVGVEFVVYRAAWDALHDQPPAFFGIPFDQKFGANAHGHADHYELHVWLWRHNPRGMFSPWNPTVTCV
jgi:hypothetical protein